MVDLDWNNIGFKYRSLPYRFRAYWKDGEWYKAGLEENKQFLINEASPVLHYGQACYEGMKAFRRKDGVIQLFRPEKNAERMAKSCERLLMPTIRTDKFVDAVKEVVLANENYVPPHDSGATLYIRPLMIGKGERLGLGPSDEYMFMIFVMPVGPYFKNGLEPANFIVTEYDRAAPNGTGAAKVAGNYAASLLPGKIAQERNFSDCIYLDPQTHTKIEEVGSSNFFAIEKGTNRFVTPLSDSILPSITKYSLLEIAEKRLGLETSEEDIYIDELDKYSEAGACGTAASVTPIGGIQYKDDFHIFYSETEVSPIVEKLYNEIVGIQFGDIEAPEGWIQTIE